jgi:hypothetical protein
MYDYDCSYGRRVSIVGGGLRPKIGPFYGTAGEERRI